MIRRIINSLCFFQIDFQLFLEADENVGFDSFDFNVFILTRRRVNPSFSEVRQFGDSRMTIELRFRVTCTDNYAGPQCDCLSQDNDINGHYLCERNGNITCLPGYEDPSTFCTRGKWKYTHGIFKNMFITII